MKRGGGLPDLPEPPGNRTELSVDRPTLREGFPDRPGPLVGDRETEIVQPVRSRREWAQFLRWGSDRAARSFTDYEFVEQTAFDRELLVVVQVAATPDTRLRLLAANYSYDGVTLTLAQDNSRGETARVTPEPGDTPVMRYLFVRVPLAEYGGERLEANLNRNERLLELIYYPQESSDG